jgi:hypothetical protein
MQVFQWLQGLDRRIIYLAVGSVLLVAVIFGRERDGIVMPPVQSFYNAVESVPNDKLILVGWTFENDTLTENGNQARAIIRHLMLRRKKFAVVNVRAPQGVLNSKAIVGDLAKQYGYTYGTDWIHFGYKLGGLVFLRPIIRDIPSAVQQDGIEKKPITSFPIMQNVRTINDIGMVVEVTASNSVFDWIGLVQPYTQPRLKIGYACTGVMTAEAYPYLDSGQISGIMPGLKGAADYEQLVNALEAKVADGQIREGLRPEKYDDSKVGRGLLQYSAMRLMPAQDWAHLTVLLFIILGNIGMWVMSGRAKKRKAG